MLFEQDIQTGLMMLVLTDFIQEQVKRSADVWDKSLKNKDRYTKHQESDLKEQDQERKNNARWSDNQG